MRDQMSNMSGRLWQIPIANDSKLKSETSSSVGESCRSPQQPNPPIAEQSFMDIDEIDQSETIWKILFGQGAKLRDEAIKKAAAELQGQSLVQFKRLQKGNHLWSAIDKNIKRGLSLNDFDRPKRGHVRAILPSAELYETADWERAVKAVVRDESMNEEEIIRAAAEWAKENCGLEFERLRQGGVVWERIFTVMNR